MMEGEPVMSGSTQLIEDDREIPANTELHEGGNPAAEGTAENTDAAVTASSKDRLLLIPESGRNPSEAASPDPAGSMVSRQEPDVNEGGSTSFVAFNRGRVVSLDGGRDLIRLEIDGAYNSSESSTDEEGKIAALKKQAKKASGARESSPEDGDGYSSGSNTSDGESSYFAKHLPSPKSGRKFSLSSAGSTSSAPVQGYIPASASSVQRESDASLSFSDDEEDWHGSDNVESNSRNSPMLSQARKDQQEVAENVQMYPSRIIRMHSVSSLVSSSSESGKQEVLVDANGHIANKTTNTTAYDSSGESANTSTTDPSVRSELRDVASSKPSASAQLNSKGDVPSGRKSPVPPHDGETSSSGNAFAGRLFTSPPRHPQQSPPTLFKSSPVNASGIVHPQPMSNEQLPPWVAPGTQVSHFMPAPLYAPPLRYGAVYMGGAPAPGIYPPPPYMVRDPNVIARYPSEASRSTGDSNTTLPFVYSDDEETDDSARNARQSAGDRRMRHRGIATKGFVDTLNTQSNLIEHRSTPPEVAKSVSADYMARGMGSSNPRDEEKGATHLSTENKKGFRVYWRRWLMLMYMSVLNLLSDWTCYSVAPISILTSQAFGDINPELLVVVFLGANAVATACEPIILSRLGLRRTVVFGSLLLMMGSIVKSGGLPPILQSELVRGRDEWRVYFGFFLVGLSQPLYQCTPALLSASWFPERERTMATGVALNANQLGIGFAFIFGTLLVATSDDIPGYFGLLSIISTITFAGCLIQFEDAPPTPPSDTARIIKGSLELHFSSVRDMIWRSVRSIGEGSSRPSKEGSRSSAVRPSTGITKPEEDNPREEVIQSDNTAHVGNATSRPNVSKRQRAAEKGEDVPKRKSRTGNGKRSNRSSSTRKSASGSGPARISGSAGTAGSGRRRSSGASRSQSASSDNGLRAGKAGKGSVPSSFLGGTEHENFEASGGDPESMVPTALAPSPMMPGRVAPSESDPFGSQSPLYGNMEPVNRDSESVGGGHYVADQYSGAGAVPGYWQHPHWDMYYQQYGTYYPAHDHYIYPQMLPPYHFEAPRSSWLDTGTIDDGAEPVLTLTPHHLDIDIRDDQIILSAKACFSRPGFIHALVSFTVSGIVINTLSTFMDYLVRLNGAGREYVGIVGGSFQFVIMISSLIIGKQTDKTRAYYSVTVGMLVLGAFGLAECGVSLDADRGGDLRWALVVVAALVGPLQPVSTELGVDVAYPLSENTVLVIQQLFSNLLSALFIPFFKAVRDVGTESIDATDMYERPQYTFSFYLLIVLHAAATVFFATFNGRYLRYEHEQAKKASEQQQQGDHGTAFAPQQSHFDDEEAYDSGPIASLGGERQPLLPS